MGSRGTRRQVRVFLSHGGHTKEILLYADLPLGELRACLAAGFAPPTDPSGSRSHPVAVKDAQKNVFYPLSLLAKAPAMFENTLYQLIFEDQSDAAASWAEEHGAQGNSRPRRTKGKPTTKKRGASKYQHHTRLEKQEQARDDIDLVSIAAEKAPEDDDESNEEEGDEDEEQQEEEEDDEDDDEFVRELDLTDFELPQLLNVFTQAAPSGVLDRDAFERCLEKILSQVSAFLPPSILHLPRPRTNNKQ